MEAVKETVAGVVSEAEAIIVIVVVLDAIRGSIKVVQSALKAVEEALFCLGREVGYICAALPFLSAAAQESFIEKASIRAAVVTPPMRGSPKEEAIPTTMHHVDQ